MEGLLKALQDNPSVDFVYFDKKGGWLLHPNTLHPNKVSREDVLNELQQPDATGNTGGNQLPGTDPEGNNTGHTVANENELQQPDATGNTGGGRKKNK